MAGTTCLTCTSKATPIICKTCRKTPFRIEEARRILAKQKNYKKFLHLYKKSFPEIRDGNNKFFWDKKLQSIVPLSSQDGMTKDRVFTAFSYIPKQSQKILDIGAGYGFIEELISKKSPDKKLYGIDISPKGVELLEKRFDGNFRVGSIYKLDYPNRYFDVILALEVLEHVPPHKIFSILKKIKKILKKNGIFILSVPVNEKLEKKRDNPSSHLREYSLELITAELHLCGFKVISHTELSAFKNFYPLKKFLKKTIFPLRWESNDLIIQAISR